MILMTPLAMPKIVPNNWDEWWDVWHKHSAVVTKTYKNHNDTQGLWKGLDLYNSTRYPITTIYSAPPAPKCAVIDDLVNQVRNSIPIIPTKIRVIENLDVVLPHSDHPYEKEELRSFLWNEYDEPVWEFEYKGIKKQLVLPESTNTWYYKDYPMTHSSIHKAGKSKGVLIVYGIQKPEFQEFVKDSADKFKDYSWVLST